MNELTHIVKNRKTPGILLVDAHGNLLCSNRQALEIITGMGREGEGGVALPDVVHRICHELQGASEVSVQDLLFKNGDAFCALRGVRLDAHDGNSVMVVLMERVVAKHEVNTEEARQAFGLSKRETQVVALLCRGMGNREIAERLFISENTVKDHIKNVMKKMKVASRHEMMALLK